MNQKNLIPLVAIFTLILIVSGFFALAIPQAHALESVIPGPGQTGYCDPSLTPNQTGACGLPAFEELLKRMMRIILILIVSVAGIFIIWGGFVIMTANGSAEKVKSGTGKIKIAITGVVIALAAYFIVQGVFKILEVQNFKPGGL